MSKSQQLFSTVRSDNTLSLSIAEREIPTPAESEVLVRIDATPLNPSDIATLLAVADISTVRSEESGTTVADIPPAFLSRFATRLDKPWPVGNEAAGEVVDAGGSDLSKALMGKTVSFATGGNYAQYRCVPAHMCLPMEEGVSARDAASSFVNPMTALGFIETMQAEGHKALINTAAASNLGQMLNRICMADGIDLINVVRKPEQENTLREMGAKYIVNSSDSGFVENLADAVAETGATIAFDAIGGGEVADGLLTAMEKAAARDMEFYDHYGSRTYKQLYIYGGLDRGKTTMSRLYGFAWGMGGWLLTNFLMKAKPETLGKMQQRISSEITTTFATHYSHEISLAEAIAPDTVKAYAKQATGEKYLICPSR